MRGEIGVLKYSAQDSNPKKARYYLYITYNNTPYVGSLLFDDMAFCRTISDILKTRIGEEISQIGNLDLSHTL